MASTDEAPQRDVRAIWENQRVFHGHTSTFKEMKLNYTRNASKGVHNFLGLEDQRFLRGESSHGMLPRKQTRDGPLGIVGAIEFGDIETVETKLDEGTSPNQANSVRPCLQNHSFIHTKGGETLLHVAVLHQHLRIVQLLIERGADVRARTPWRPTPLFQDHTLLQYAYDTASDGATPLHYACALSNIHLVKVLVAAGAEIDCGINEMCGSPLVWALRAPERPVDVVKLLLTLGASPHCLDMECNSTIAMAVLWWSEPDAFDKVQELVALFVAAGVDIQLKNTCGWTAWDVATSERVKTFLQTKFGAASGRYESIEHFGNLERERNEGQPWLKPLYRRPPVVNPAQVSTEASIQG
ncbi:hypothetical protein AeMF1_014461 [Aphanomyces euteiches]|nr:hypothetical protein AeMF1_014461 [Aphanomyces euteiches]KAH9184659.1 hypothetical protein AeNC1_013364 [Aphanomyces euteiches]